MLKLGSIFNSGVMMATKKTTNEQTSKKVASAASKLLSNPKAPANVKSVAASALTQAPNKKSIKGKK